MNLSQQIAKHFRELFFGGNWTDSNIKDVLKDVNRETAITKLPNYNSIAELVYHIHYFVHAALQVLENKPLNAHDKFSFDVPPINTDDDWNKQLQTVWNDATKIANLIEILPNEKLNEVFTDEKYGTYYRNLQGIIEHSHYHLGQIVIMKKLLSQP